VPDPPPPAGAPSHEERSDETGGRLADLERAAETLLLSAPARR
jgi:hypothetical protein